MEKFKTLVHNGPVFTENRFNRYGDVLDLRSGTTAHDMVLAYAEKAGTDYVRDRTFNLNFFTCLGKLDGRTPAEAQAWAGPYIAEASAMIAARKAAAASESPEDRKASAAARKSASEALQEKYGFAILDGKRQPLGNYAVEPCGIIFTRGASPVKGLWKYTVRPEDVVVNVAGGPAPEPPAGHKWKAVEHNTNGFYTAYYDINVGDVKTSRKYILFGAASSVKQSADQHKFEKARKLLLAMPEIDRRIDAGLGSKDRIEQETALIVYLVSRTAIRIGTEKDLDVEADTVGASTLRACNVRTSFSDGKHAIALNFIGKDSVPFKGTFVISEKAAAALEKCLTRCRTKQSRIFEAGEKEVNDFIKAVVPDASIKTFRTAYGTGVLCEELKKRSGLGPGATVEEKLNAFNEANLAVAKKLNHKRAVPKGYTEQLAAMRANESRLKARAQEAQKKADAEKSALCESAGMAERLLRGAGKRSRLAELKEKMAEAQEKADEAKRRYCDYAAKRRMKELTADSALGTSRTNYSSPRITVSWCKDNCVPIDRIYSRTLMDKFDWAMDETPDYWKKYPKN